MPRIPEPDTTHSSSSSIVQESTLLLPPLPRQASTVSGPRHGFASSGGTQLPDPERRDGLQHRHLPSRRGNTLVYRDGRTELIEQDAPQAQPAPRRLRQWDLEQVAAAEGRKKAA